MRANSQPVGDIRDHSFDHRIDRIDESLCPYRIVHGSSVLPSPTPTGSQVMERFLSLLLFLADLMLPRVANHVFRAKPDGQCESEHDSPE